MKKREIWISIAIIAAAVLLLFFYSRGQGGIGIDAGGATAVLQLRNNWFKSIAITSGAEPASASAGVHRPRRLNISMEQDGHKWRIDSGGPWANLSRIRVKNDKTTVIRLGPPFLIKPRIRKSGSDLSIDFAIIGQAGEQYQNFVRKNDHTITGAKLKIVDEAGNVLMNDRFKYG